MNNRHTKMNVEFLVLVLILPLLLLANELAAPGTGMDLTSGAAVEEAADQDAQQESNVQTLPGFEVQMLYEVPTEEQGSWVALAVLPNGDLVASDEDRSNNGGNGLYRVSIGGTLENPEVDVEDMSIFQITGAQGLEYAFGNLYVNINGVGLFILSSNGNGEFNSLEYVEESPDGGGEHGNHSVITTEDGEALYIVNGNHSTNLPLDYTTRLASWDEDILLPRNWDARGHARGILAPGGYISRVSPDGTDWEIVSMGYRNTYDIALNQQGELFAYDADMEWDMGMPWYRPTRIMHAVSGSDTGWRSGDGKWKEYFEDSIPATYNIGPGSPVGLLFGTGAKFPARYQRALYSLDWTFGTMRAIHLTPDGSSYTAEAEEFISGVEFPFTDAVIGQDGNMYFTTGGRNGQSYLWRVVYTGNESTAAVSPEDPNDTAQTRQARATRHRLEAFHGQRNPQAVNAAWEYLNSSDRFLRNAARVAIEWQPAETWADRALNESRPQARITAITALARVGSEEYRSDAIESLMEMNPAALTTDQQLSYLRAMGLVFMRMGDPSNSQRIEITNTLNRMLPSNDDRLNVELVRMQVYLDDSRVIGKALALMNRQTESPVLDWDPQLLERSGRYGGTINAMRDNPPPTNELDYAGMLRYIRNGWTTEQRRQYFTFINEASDAAGGATYTLNLEIMRDQALANATDEEMAAVADLVDVSLAREPDFEINPPQGPGRQWTQEEAELALFGPNQQGGGGFFGRNRSIQNVAELSFENGRSLFYSVGCASCHRFAGYGGNIGPDISAAAGRFGVTGIVEKILNPNDMVADQYRMSEVVLNNGRTVVGLVVEREGELEVYSQDPSSEPTVVDRNDVETVRQVETSQMPPGLINVLNASELRDLMAYLQSGGDPESDVYSEEVAEN